MKGRTMFTRLKGLISTLIGIAMLVAAPLAATDYMLTGPTVAVSGATNASPIVVTTATHSYVTGDIVRIRGVQGNTCTNGYWKVTVLSATTFSLDGSTGCGTYSANAGDFSTLMGARANGSSSWFPTDGAQVVRIYVYGSAAVTGSVAIQGSSSPFSYGADGPIPVNAPAFTLATVTNPTTTGEYWFVTSGRVRVTISGWSAGTVYALIEAYGQDGRRLY